MTSFTASAALDTPGGAWSEADLERAIAACAEHLRLQGVTVLATRLDNGPAWVVADAAAHRSGVVHVPLPLFFSEAQVDHALRTAGAQMLWLPAANGVPGVQRDFTGLVQVREQCLQHAERPPLPDDTRLVTFTSGSTGNAKGVCIGAAQLELISRSLGDALQVLDIRRHLCALPLAVLLEHVAGVLTPLTRGATVILRPLSAVGLAGSSRFNPAKLDAAVRETRPQSLILLPQQLRAWTGWLLSQGLRAPDSLALVAVGGAPVGEANLLGARALGLPVYEGYGLSEGGSVQTLNLPGSDRPGSVGRPLPHARVRISDDGEIEIAGALSLGYLGEPASTDSWRATGDLGRLDADGFLHVDGRRKQLLITAFGRNVSPEWVETELHQQPEIAHAVVLGDGEPELGAVLWPSSPLIDDTALAQAVRRANLPLPDYARITRWTRGRAPFLAESGFATPNGRPRRSAIARDHAELLFPTSAAIPSTP